MKKENFTQTKDIFIFSSKLAPLATKILLKLPIKEAYYISIFSFLFIFIPAPMIAFGDYWVVFIGALLLQVPIILDFSDGAVARFKGTTDNLGEYYCTFQHNFIPPILMISLSINSYRHFNNPMWLVIGSITVLAMYLTNYSRIIKDCIAVDYQFRKNKIITKSQKLNLVIGDTKEGMKDTYMFCRTDNHNIISNIVYFFNSFSHMMTTFFILAIFNVIHYALFFYAPFYISISIAKFWIEINKGMREYEFKLRK